MERTYKTATLLAWAACSGFTPNFNKLCTFPLFMPFQIHDFARAYWLYADCWGKQSTSWETPIAGPFAWILLFNWWIEAASAMQCLLVRTRMWLVCYLPNAVRLQTGLALHRNMSTVYRNASIRECAKSSLECRQVKLVFWWCPWTGGISAGNKQSTPNNSKLSKSSTCCRRFNDNPRDCPDFPRISEANGSTKCFEGGWCASRGESCKSIDEALIFAEHMQSSKLKANDWSTPTPTMHVHAKIIQYPEGIGMRHTLCMQVGKYKVDNFGAVRMPFAQLRLSIFRRPSTDTGSLSSPLPDSLMWDGPEYWVYLWQTYHALVSLRLGQRVALSAAPSSDDLKVPRAVNAHHFELFRSDAVSYLDTKGSKVKEFQDVNCQSVRWVMDCPRHRICSMSVMLRGNCGA